MIRLAPFGLDMYKSKFISTDTPWTILSYEIYNTIDYWWVLSSINKDYPFYAPEGTDIKYIEKSLLKNILSNINS